MTAPPRDRFGELRDAVYEASFSPRPDRTRGIGVEVELLAHDAATNFPLALHSGRVPLVPAVERIAQRRGWRAFTAYDGTARFDIPNAGTISFEPGGQIEISSVPFASVNDVLAGVRSVLDALQSSLEEQGVVLRSIGIDPYNDARDIPMQLPVERYQRMTEYLEQVGPFGIRMMRQTAALQLSIDRGENPSARWRLLNDLAPYVTAIFANSPLYLRRDTAHQSVRADCWRRLDATRTGVAEESDDAASAYTRFALGANDMMRRDEDGRYRTFAHWLAQDGSGDFADARWASHLTTLFPEVRPRGHFELRSCDAVPLEWLAAPIVFVTALVYDERASEAAAVLSAESRALLRVAGELGVHDAGVARTARDLFQLALDGASRLGHEYVAPALVECAAEFSARYTARGRSLADDVLANASVALDPAPIRSSI